MFLALLAVSRKDWVCASGFDFGLRELVSGWGADCCESDEARHRECL